MVLETLVSSAFNHLTRLAARDLLRLVAVKASNHTTAEVHAMDYSGNCKHVQRKILR
jgi:hypothetical protein